MPIVFNHFQVKQADLEVQKIADFRSTSVTGICFFGHYYLVLIVIFFSAYCLHQEHAMFSVSDSTF